MENQNRNNTTRSHETMLKLPSPSNMPPPLLMHQQDLLRNLLIEQRSRAQNAFNRPLNCNLYNQTHLPTRLGITQFSMLPVNGTLSMVVALNQIMAINDPFQQIARSMVYEARSTAFPQHRQLHGMMQAHACASRLEYGNNYRGSNLDQIKVPVHNSMRENIRIAGKNSDPPTRLCRKRKGATTSSCTDDLTVQSNNTTKCPSLSAKRPRQSSKWYASFHDLKNYKAEHGDCVVPRGFPSNPRLASWVAEQRKQYRLFRAGQPSSITPERIKLLDEVNFAWNAQEAAWSKHIKDLHNFRSEHGHCNVPLKHPKYPKLGLWVKEQRRHFTLLKQGKPSHMTSERVQQLDQIGFCWDTHEETWYDRFQDLKEFKRKYGTCSVPTTYSESPRLSTWVNHQRRQYKRFMDGKQSHITAERIGKLDSIGFNWNQRATNAKSSDSSTNKER